MKRVIPCTLLIFTVLTACSIRIDWPEHTIRVEMANLGPPTDRFTMARIAVESVELMPCSDRFVWNFVPEAHAHGTSTPTRSGINVVFDLLASSREIATLTPPNGEYCKIVVIIGPADEDAVARERTSMIGHSVGLEARRGDEIIEIYDSLKSEITLDLSEEPLQLDDARRDLTFVIELPRSEWQQTMDMTSDEAPRVLLRSIRTSAEWRTP